MIPLPVYTEAALLTLEAGRVPIFPDDDGHVVDPSVMTDVYDDLWVEFAVADLVDAWNRGDAGPECAA